MTEGDTGRAVLSGVTGGVFLALFVLYAIAMGSRGVLSRIPGLIERVCVATGLAWVAVVSLALWQGTRH